MTERFQRFPYRLNIASPVLTSGYVEWSACPAVLANEAADGFSALDPARV
ncbi:hypothetical protein ACFWBV_09290 [Streptomyces sp. NPDC060030]